MKISEIKAMSIQDIKNKIQELKQHLFDNYQKLSKGELKNFNVIKTMRRDIARMLTVAKAGGLPEQSSAPAKVEEKKVEAKKTKIEKEKKPKKEKALKEKKK